MDQSYSLFTLIFKGVHEPFGFRVLYWMEYISDTIISGKQYGKYLK